MKTFSGSPRTSLFRALVCSIAALAVAQSIHGLSALSWTEWAASIGISAIGACAAWSDSRRSVVESRGALSYAALMLAAIWLGAAPAILVAASVESAVALRRGDSIARRVFSVACSVAIVAVAALAFPVAYRIWNFMPAVAWMTAGGGRQELPLGWLLVPLCAATAAIILLEAFTERLCCGGAEYEAGEDEERSLGETLTGTGALARWAGAAAALLAYATLRGTGVVYVVLGAFVLLLVHLLYRFNDERIAEVERREQEKVRHIEEVATLHLNTIESLAIAIDAKDQMTHGHVRRTQIYAMRMGEYLGLSGSEMQALEAGALLHDVGKLAVPEYILNKPGKLTAAEFDKMKTHTTVGGDIIRRVGFPYPVEEIVRYHHERWDGTGYPRGLRREQIPAVARIIAVVDFYDATRCDRPYRRGMTRDESLALIRSMAGSSFDPKIVETFIEHIDELDALIAESDIKEQVASAPAEMTGTLPDAGLAADTLGTSGDPLADSGYDSILAAQREVFALHEIAQTIGSSLNLHDTLTLVTGKLGKIVPFSTCVIYLTSEQTGRAHAVHVAGSRAESYRDRRITLGEGVTGWVIANGRAMCNTPPELDLVGVDREAADAVRALLAVPLVADGASFGALTLLAEDRGSYTSEHVRLLESVAQYAAVALNNALTYERTKESALTDTLTNLPNARALRFILEQSIAESERLGDEPLAVLCFNLADFKSVNEIHGRAAGDRILVEAANLIRAQFRSIDTLARYTGDEFIAVMPMAADETASLVADAVRAAFAHHEFTPRGSHALRLGVHIGVACRPEHRGIEDLLAAADREMRRDKLSSRAAAHVPTSYLDPRYELAR